MNARAIVTTKWDGKTYRPLTITAIERYFIDTALDTDADQWTVEIGDPETKLARIFERDNEVRVQLYGVTNQLHYLATGYADEMSRSTDGVVKITGRDLSALATDSALLPNRWKHVRAHTLIEQQARQIGFPGPFVMNNQGIVKKLQVTDGSETYWEFWYRMVRKEKMWLWTSPDGTLNMDNLLYDAKPTYYIGIPPKGAPASAVKQYLPVFDSDLHKSSQTRIYEVWAFFHRGNWGDVTFSRDNSMKDWQKKPRKIISDLDARTGASATKLASEEIFEGKVGSIEFVVSIPHTNTPIKPNRIAFVNLPTEGISGEYFVVGNRIVGDSEGFIQQVRLREKIFALTRRVPPTPKLDTGEPKGDVTNALGVELNVRWATFFIAAAREFHGPWNFPLFLATLIGMCDEETSFNNVRRYGGPGGGDRVEWFPPPGSTSAQEAHQHGENAPKITLEQWRTRFANEAGDGYVSEDYAVGPMQLYTLSYKHWADDYFRPNFRNEFTGGRWHPEHNIRASARALREKLRAHYRGAEGHSDNDIWAGVRDYNGAGPVAERYATSIRNKVYNNPGYLQMVKDSIAAATKAANQTTPLPPDFGQVPNTGRNSQSSAVAAKRILNYMNAGRFRDDRGGNEARRQWEKVARGQKLLNQCGQAVYIHPNLPNIITYLLDKGYMLGTFAIVEEHSCNNGQHPKGQAIDLSSVGRVGVGFYNIGHQSGPQVTRLVKEVMIHCARFGVYNLICNGVKGVPDTSVQALQYMAGSRHGGFWEEDHLDHIHVGVTQNSVAE